MKQWMLRCGLILAVAITVLFANLGKARLWDRDEPRNASCAEEMLRRGDLITPIFNDELRSAKPVLLYWLIMSAYQVFGVNEFSARFWSALLGCGTVLLTYANGRRMFNAAVGLLSAIVLATSLMFVVAGRAATPDSTLIFFVTLALTIFVHAAFKPRDALAVPAVGEQPIDYRSHWPGRWYVVAIMYAVMGVGILAKGPVALILPVAIIGLFLLIVRLPEFDAQKISHRGRYTQIAFRCLRPFALVHFLKTCWSMRPLTAVGVSLLVAAPWFIAVGFRTDGDFLQQFFLNEHFGRATTAMENHQGNLLYYPLAMLVGFFPWSVFAVPLLWFVGQRFAKHDPWRDGYLFSVCWVVVWVSAFSIARTKLPSYVTPCYPALALMMGCFLHRWLERPTELSARIYKLALGCLIVVGLALTIAIPIVTAKILAGQQWLMAIGMILMLGGAIALFFQWTSRYGRAVLTLSCTAVVFCVALFAVGATVVGDYQQSPKLFSALPDHGEADEADLAAFGCMESSWVFYSKRPVHELARRQETIPLRQRSRDWKPKPKTDLKTFFAEHDNPYLITTGEHVDEVRESLGIELEIVSEVDYFLKDESLVLLKPAEGPSQTARRLGNATR